MGMGSGAITRRGIDRLSCLPLFSTMKRTSSKGRKRFHYLEGSEPDSLRRASYR